MLLLQFISMDFHKEIRISFESSIILHLTSGLHTDRRMKNVDRYTGQRGSLVLKLETAVLSAYAATQFCKDCEV